MAAAEALTNALIVDAILKRCPDPSDIIQFRLVSTLWNEVILSFNSPPRVTVHLNRVVPWRGQVAQGPFISRRKLSSFPQKLLKSVALIAHPDHDAILPQAIDLLAHAKVSPHIQHLSVLGGASVGKFVHHIFAKCEFENLKNLRVVLDEERVHTYQRRYRDDVTLPEVSNPEISEKPKLLKIQYIVESKVFLGSDVSEEQQKFLGFLLAVTPNLESLRVKDDYFSELPAILGNLSEFRFTWNIRLDNTPDMVTLRNLNKFLEIVKVSLERLQLTVGFTGSRRSYDFAQFSGEFRFPADGIKNLKWFENGAMRIFKCGVRDLEKMGKLQHLDLCEIPNEVLQKANVYMGNILKRNKACWGGVTNLKLCWIEDLELLEKIGPSFPSLRRLNINVRLWNVNRGELNIFLRMIFERLASIKALTHISVGAPFPTRFSGFVDFLEYLATSFQDVSEVRLEHCTCDEWTEDGPFQRFYVPAEVDAKQMRRFRSLVPALLGCRELTEITGVDIARLQKGLVFRKGSPFQSELPWK
ncbi:uncharacterized protein LOC118433280 [Folsomia candida]|uniref:F-box domain-containing protein n=1 Tax=Folsomia candida TaxID=158441 RepID=A0A226D0J8_FOLCA|nr:uncharacterized protein LOC118433280 [Folsomia candida]OXA38394.1 hypothetical protein Fcan01_26884 [Folsomia candida]